MSGNINEVTLLGNLGADPDVRVTNNGHKVAGFSLATNEAWTKDGVKHERTEWHRVVVFGDALIDKLVAPHVTKGKTVLVRGTLRTRKWTDSEGSDRWTTEIVVGARNTYLQLVGTNGGHGNASGGDQTPPPPSGDPDDEIPL